MQKYVNNKNGNIRMPGTEKTGCSCAAVTQTTVKLRHRHRIDRTEKVWYDIRCGLGWKMPEAKEPLFSLRIQRFFIPHEIGSGRMMHALDSATARLPGAQHARRRKRS